MIAANSEWRGIGRLINAGAGRRWTFADFEACPLQNYVSPEPFLMKSGSQRYHLQLISLLKINKAYKLFGDSVGVSIALKLYKLYKFKQINNHFIEKKKL